MSKIVFPILLIALVIVLLAWPVGSYAGIRPSFSLEYCSWNATDIVIADEGKEIDGKLMVVESLKGDLKPGETISVPELAAFAPESERLIRAPFGEKGWGGDPKYVSGSRMIVFLKRKTAAVNDGLKAADLNKPPGSSGPVWEAASLFGGMSASVAWIEGEHLFAFIQVINPGPSILVEYGKTAMEVRGEMAAVIRTQNELLAAASIPDKYPRAEALLPFTSSEIFVARRQAFEEVEKCGEAALPTLRRILNDPSKLNLQGRAIESMGKIGGKNLGPELTRILAEELKFWNATGPRLKVGWWNDVNDPETQNLRDQYGKALQAIRGLTAIKFAGSREVAKQFRDFWRSLPQLEDPSGLNQMSRECDGLLKEIS